MREEALKKSVDVNQIKIVESYLIFIRYKLSGLDIIKDFFQHSITYNVAVLQFCFVATTLNIITFWKRQNVVKNEIHIKSVVSTIVIFVLSAQNDRRSRTKIIWNVS